MANADAMATGFWWLLIVLIVLGCTSHIADIGKPRKPTTSGAVAFITLVNGLLIWGIAYFGLMRG